MYFPYWLNVAEVLAARGAAMHLLLVADRRSASDAINAGQELIAAMSRLRGNAREIERIFSYSFIPVPKFVQDARTFFACARYLLLRRTAEHLGTPVLVADMDLSLRDDPDRFFSAIQTRKLGLSPASGLFNLSPWRRFIANTLTVPVSVQARQYLTHVENYLAYGLGPVPDGRPRRWMLDQNALDYMFEKIRAAEDMGCLQDLTQIPRPTKRDPVMAALEGLQR